MSRKHKREATLGTPETLALRSREVQARIEENDSKAHAGKEAEKEEDILCIPLFWDEWHTKELMTRAVNDKGLWDSDIEVTITWTFDKARGILVRLTGYDGAAEPDIKEVIRKTFDEHKKGVVSEDWDSTATRYKEPWSYGVPKAITRATREEYQPQSWSSNAREEREEPNKWEDLSEKEQRLAWKWYKPGHEAEGSPEPVRGHTN